MMKFRLSFTIPSEALFSIMSRMLPIEDLHVEELTPQRESPPLGLRKAQAQESPPTPKLPRKKHLHKQIDLKSGINRIILDIMADGKPHKATEFMPLIERVGYSRSSVGSRLAYLSKRNIVYNQGDGTWKINQELNKTGTSS